MECNSSYHAKNPPTTLSVTLARTVMEINQTRFTLNGERAKETNWKAITNLSRLVGSTDDTITWELDALGLIHGSSQLSKDG